MLDPTAPALCQTPGCMAPTRYRVTTTDAVLALCAEHTHEHLATIGDPK